MENDIIRVKVLGLGAALAAGFVPDQGYLKNAKTGASISQTTLTAMANTVQKGIKTGADSYPVTINGTIFHEGLISAEVQKHEFKNTSGQKKELVRFDDGSLGLDHLNGSVDVLTVETIAAVHADGKKTASKA